MAAAMSAAVILIAGYFLRLLLMLSDYAVKIQQRPEFSTPVNSWKRVIEGSFLLKHGIDPYTGDILHEGPMSLKLYTVITYIFKGNLLKHFFIITDLTSALLLCLASRKCIQILLHQDRTLSKAQSSKNLVLALSTAKQIPVLVLVIYCLSPFNILSCVSQNTTIFDNLLHTITIFSMVYGMWPIAAITLSFLTYRTLHAVILIVPCLAFVRHRTPCMLFVSAYIAILAHLVSQNTDYYSSTYLFQLSVNDLNQNIGLFWYFFTEVFDHFRTFFLFVFQINILMYIAPLTIKLRKDPLMLYWSVIVLLAIFKPYPSLADFAFYTSLLPIFRHLFDSMKQVIIIFCTILVCAVLAPMFWHQWIYAYSGNSNFYFAITLVFNVAQIFLLTDLLVADMKRKFFLQFGDIKEFESKKLKLSLE